MSWLFQITIMTLTIGSNGAYHWAPHETRLAFDASDPVS
jgi:hypothetical protein